MIPLLQIRHNCANTYLQTHTYKYAVYVCLNVSGAAAMGERGVGACDADVLERGRE